MKPKLYAALVKLVVNWWPCIRGGAGKVIYLSEDFMRLTVRLKLSWRTRNIVGTIYGGSMYASTDPFYMLMLREIFGKDFIVWDKGCTIRFKRPAKETIFAEFVISAEMLKGIKDEVQLNGETSFTWPLEYKSKSGTVYVEFDKTLYVATKSFYKEKLKRRTSASVSN